MIIINRQNLLMLIIHFSLSIVKPFQIIPVVYIKKDPFSSVKGSEGTDHERVNYPGTVFHG